MVLYHWRRIAAYSLPRWLLGKLVQMDVNSVRLGTCFSRLSLLRMSEPPQQEPGEVRAACLASEPGHALQGSSDPPAAGLAILVSRFRCPPSLQLFFRSGPIGHCVSSSSFFEVIEFELIAAVAKYCNYSSPCIIIIILAAHTS